jgi:L-rhamnose-H+ transport protein
MRAEETTAVTSISLGLCLLLLAGAMNGSFTLPMKFTRRWAWENTWLAWTLFALVLFPPLLASFTIPSLGQVYAQAGPTPIATVAACGAGWGVAQVFFGLAVDAVGMALAFSVILGLSAAVGSLIPLVRFHPEKILTTGGLVVISGVALVLVGIAVCAVAGRKREAALGQGPVGKPSVTKGLTFCLLSGLGSALVNFGLAFGGPLIAAARQAGAAPLWAPNAVWLPLMCAGAVPNLLYCLYLLARNHTGARFGASDTSSYWALAMLMAFFWFGSTVMYGVATVKLGELGTVLGWPLFMTLIVITATVWGVVTGEWKSSGRRPLLWMSAGVLILVLAVFVLSAATRMM